MAPNNRARGRRAAPQKQGRVKQNNQLGMLNNSRQTRMTKPKTVTRGNGFEIVNREMFCTVTSSTADEYQFFGVDASSATSFPWLSSIAERFQYYEFFDLKFEYKPMTAATTSGIVTLTFLPDPEDERPRSVGEALTSATNSLVTPPYVAAVIKADTSELTPRRKYVQHRHTDQQLRMISAGSFIVRTSGFDFDGVTMGMIFVSYKVRLSMPSLLYGDAAHIMPSRSASYQLPSSQNFATTLQERINFSGNGSTDNVDNPAFEKLGWGEVTTGIFKIAAGHAYRAFAEVDVRNTTAATVLNTVFTWIRASQTADLVSLSPTLTATTVEASHKGNHETVGSANKDVSISHVHVVSNTSGVDQYYAMYCTPTFSAGTVSFRGSSRLYIQSL